MKLSWGVRNTLYFLCGCVIGTLVTFSFYCLTAYFLKQAAGQNPSSVVLDLPQQPQRSALLVNLAHFFTSERTEEEDYGEDVMEGLLIVVVSSIQDLQATINLVARSWGHSANAWKVAVGTKGLHKKLPSSGEGHLLIDAQKCSDFPSGEMLPPEQLFCLLAAVHNEYSRHFKWFMVALNSTYIAARRLSAFLTGLDHNQVHYLGQPSSYSIPEMSRLRLNSKEHICRGESGIILSRAALVRIAPHLQHCLGVRWMQPLIGGGESRGEVELGRCFSRRLDVTCSDSLEVDPVTLFVSYSVHIWLLENFMTYYPVNSSRHMLSVYFNDLTKEHSRLQSKATNSARYIESLCLRLSSPELRAAASLCNFSSSGTSLLHLAAPGLELFDSAAPLSLWEVVRWELVTDNKIFNSEKSSPVRGIPRDIVVELQFILNKSLSIIKPENSSPLKMQDVYLRYSGNLGREYILDLELLRKDQVVERRVSLLFPHLGDVIYVDTAKPTDTTVEFVIPLSNVNERLTEFLKIYEDVCLVMEDKCGLNLVVYGYDDARVISGYLRNLKRKYSGAKLRVIVGSGRFSRGRALELGLAELSASDLVFICDVDMIIERSFLRRCRRNAIQGKRVYYPEFFKYYNMDYVYPFSRSMPWGREISRQHGHWAMYSYGMLCSYKSDLDRVGGFNSRIEGWGGEDVDLAKRILANKLDIFRTPDPALSHRYHDKVCSTNLTPEQFRNCISSRNEDMADRAQLAEYVFYLEDKFKVKHWHLWSGK